jgi:hypothetical protein
MSMPGKRFWLALLAGPALAAAMAQPADALRYPQAAAVVLLDQRVVTLDDQGRSSTEGHLLIRILQERARDELGDQKIPFRGDAQSCEVLAARTHLPSGRTLEPEAAGIMEVADPEAAVAPFYSSARLKVVTFPGIQVGAVIELRYRVRPLPGATEAEPFMGERLFAGGEPVLNCSLTLRVPPGAGLNYEMFNGAPAPAIRAGGSAVEYTWTLRDQPQVVQEAGMVSYQDLVPRLVWSVARNRRELGRWLFQQFQAAARPDPAVRAQALALTAGLAGAEAKVARLALFVIREIQYVPLGLGRVGYRPTPAGVILANRYADARDKVVLFQALLAAVGLEAQPVLVRERRARISALACLPEYQAILARVPLAAGSRFYDLAQDQARLGQLLPEDADRPALLVGPAGGEAITTPAADPRGQFVRARWEARLDAQGDLTGQVTMAFGGLFDHQVRQLLSGLDEDEEKVLFQAVANGIKPGARLEDYQVSGLQDLTSAPVVKLALRIPAFAVRQGGTMILNLPAELIPVGESLVRPLLPAVRYPFLVPASFAMVAELDLKLPAGYGIGYRPRTRTVRQGPFAFQLVCQPRSRRLRLRSAMAWRGAVVRPEAYPALWQAFNRASGPENGLVLLERGRSAAPDGLLRVARITRPRRRLLRAQTVTHARFGDEVFRPRRVRL